MRAFLVKTQSLPTSAYCIVPATRRERALDRSGSGERSEPLEQRSVNGTSPELREEVARGDCTPLSERLNGSPREVIVKQQLKIGS